MVESVQLALPRGVKFHFWDLIIIASLLIVKTVPKFFKYHKRIWTVKVARRSSLCLSWIPFKKAPLGPKLPEILRKEIYNKFMRHFKNTKRNRTENPNIKNSSIKNIDWRKSGPTVCQHRTINLITKKSPKKWNIQTIFHASKNPKTQKEIFPKKNPVFSETMIDF